MGEMYNRAKWALIAILWMGYLSLAYFLSAYGRFGAIDFRIYYRNAEILLAGERLYQGFEGAYSYLYPPLLAQMLMPVASIMNVEVAWVVWFALNTLLMFGTIWLLVPYIPSKQRWLVWLLPVLFWALLEALVIGQVTIILLALYAAAWVAVKENRPAIAGAVLALAVWIKVYPIVFILYFIWKRNWRLVFSAGAWGVILLLIQVAISGITPFPDMVTTLITLSSQGESHLLSANSSVYGFASQLFEDNSIVQSLVVNSTAYIFTRIGLTIAISAITLYSVSRSPAHTALNKLDERFNLEYALVLTSSLLISPTLWVSGMPPLILVYFLLWYSRPQGRRGRYIAWFCLIACLLLTVYYIFIIGYTPNPPQSGLLLSFGFYTIMATWGLIVYLLKSLTTMPTVYKAP